MKTQLLTIVITALCLTIGIAACATDKKQQNTQDKTTKDMNEKKLVVFFSHTGENYNVGVIEKGNTHIIAEMIANKTGAELFEIVPEKDYPTDYNECIAIAKKELQADARPAVKGDIAIEDYDVVFIGYPNWWGEVPMCVYTFIEKHDWTGKKVIPFITHEGSGMGGTDKNIEKACNGANVLVGKGLAIQGKTAQENQTVAKQSVERWLGGLGF